MKPFVSYIRVSTQRQGQSGLGLEAQQAAVAQHVNGHGRLLAEYREIETGKKKDRPELLKAIEHAETIEGYPHKYLIKRAIKEEFGVGKTGCERYITEARKRLREMGEESVEDMRAESIATWKGVICDPLSSIREKMKARSELDKLLGIRKAVPIELSGPGGCAIPFSLEQGLQALENAEREQARQALPPVVPAIPCDPKPGQIVLEPTESDLSRLLKTLDKQADVQTGESAKDAPVDKAELLKETAKCRKDPAYFILTYCKVFDADKQAWISFSLWPRQVETLADIHGHKRLVIFKARQLGLTWLVLAYALWLMMFKRGTQVGLWSLREKEASELVKTRLLGMYLQLPEWMRSTKIKQQSNLEILRVLPGSVPFL